MAEDPYDIIRSLSAEVTSLREQNQRLREQVSQRVVPVYLQGCRVLLHSNGNYVEIATSRDDYVALFPTPIPRPAGPPQT